MQKLTLVILRTDFWAAENETLKTYGLNTSGSSSSVAEVWRGSQGSTGRALKYVAFSCFPSTVRGAVWGGSAGWCAQTAVRPSSTGLQLAFVFDRCRFSRVPWHLFQGFIFRCPYELSSSASIRRGIQRPTHSFLRRGFDICQYGHESPR